jgi:SAM-dependent MidA family methyltransferase
LDRFERFDHFVDRCLYGPGGFYADGGTAGRGRGDFLTSPEVGPLFGAVVFRYLDEVWQGAGRPDGFTVYDVGAGPGTLLRTVKVAADDAAAADGVDRRWRLVGVDRIPRDGIEADQLPSDLSQSVVLANELLDNLAFRVVQRAADGGFQEVAVDRVDGSEALIETDLSPDGPLAIEPGTRAPVHQHARRWVSDVVARLPLAVALFDYGAPTTVELARRGGWLRTYRGHERGHDPLDQPGTRDITTDIGWDQLPRPDRLETQAEFLHRWGIEELVDQGRAYWAAHAARPDLRALRMRSRLTEVGALVDTDALGGWWVATWQPARDERVAPVR